MKNKILIVLMTTIILMTSGCGNDNYLKNDKKEIITYKETGQQLRKDILCKPDGNEEIYKLYKENEKQLTHDLDDLPSCENFKMNSNETNSLWELIFVKPTAFAITSIGKLVGNLGTAVILVGILIRILLLPLQIKTSKQSSNMKKAGPELKRLEQKYANRTDSASQMMKSQEMMAIYKKYDINLLTGCLPALIQLPVFFAFLSAIYRLPSIYNESLLGFNLGMTPLTAIGKGEYQYIILMILIALSTFFSFKHTMNQNPAMNEGAAKQSKTMLRFMTVFILFSSLMFPTALNFYWIATYAFIAIQTEIISYILGDKKFTFKLKKEELKKESTKKIKDRIDKKEGKKYGKDNN